jgi:erythronate-4-phosphate dehydrogenase
MMMIYKAACKYFGLEVKFNVDSFLPEPSVKQLKICVNDESEQDLLRDAVGEIYSISEDDSKMRKILNVAADKRGEFFDSLRRDYPVRREFQNTKIILEPPCKSIVEKLSGIGFKG